MGLIIDILLINVISSFNCLVSRTGLGIWYTITPLPCPPGTTVTLNTASDNHITMMKHCPIQVGPALLFILVQCFICNYSYWCPLKIRTNYGRSYAPTCDIGGGIEKPCDARIWMILSFKYWKPSQHEYFYRNRYSQDIWCHAFSKAFKSFIAWSEPTDVLLSSLSCWHALLKRRGLPLSLLKKVIILNFKLYHWLQDLASGRIWNKEDRKHFLYLMFLS